MVFAFDVPGHDEVFAFDHAGPGPLMTVGELRARFARVLKVAASQIPIFSNSSAGVPFTDEVGIGEKYVAKPHDLYAMLQAEGSAPFGEAAWNLAGNPIAFPKTSGWEGRGKWEDYYELPKGAPMVFERLHPAQLCRPKKDAHFAGGNGWKSREQFVVTLMKQ